MLGEWNSASCDGHRWIPLNDGHRCDRLAYHAAGGDYRAASDGYIWKDNRAGTYESILLDLDALCFAEMGDDGDAHAQRSTVFNGDEVRARRIQDDVIADPNPLAHVHAAPAMQTDAQASRAGQNARQVLENTITNTS